MDKDLTLILALISSGLVTLGSFFGTAKAFLEYLKAREETKRKALEAEKDKEKEKTPTDGVSRGRKLKK